ncbi:hypothetical protein DPMN_037788 [Dreissena polymorpha]|uniref:Uncharacterized protein n=1 Tax=Dreissena polymorpha TaxID=45954 RepID=A0A9D4RPI7_DREPO|nr:hypothetical protein DPMN_037788 [Dreissena polymorpha]
MDLGHNEYRYQRTEIEEKRQTVVSPPEPLMWYSNMRTEREILLFEYINKLFAMQRRDFYGR